MRTIINVIRNDPAIDFAAIRQGMAELPRASRHEPGARIDDPDAVYTPMAHRSAVDPERPLVVGNRGAGKSLWAHALLSKEVRAKISLTYRQPALESVIVAIGFNGAEKLDPIAPSPDQIESALASGFAPDIIWRALLARALAEHAGSKLPDRFSEVVSWVQSDIERYQELMTRADDSLVASGRKMIIVFDALDRLPGNWSQIRGLTQALMQRTVAIKSFRAIRFKVFMRPDQFADRDLFAFPDGSKIFNDHVILRWWPHDLYGLLFYELERKAVSGPALKAAAMAGGAEGALRDSGRYPVVQEDDRSSLIALIAGPFMGTDPRRGRVSSWVPTHLADARGDCSPRTFLTAWRVAAEHQPAPRDKAVDHLGINEGVRQASSDRLRELSEDYPWVRTVLEPLKDASVPIERDEIESIWRSAGTVERVFREASSRKFLAPIELELPYLVDRDATGALVKTLETIGVVEVRRNGKINVPDIFRVEAGIKRRGGVAVPKR